MAKCKHQSNRKSNILLFSKEFETFCPCQKICVLSLTRVVVILTSIETQISRKLKSSETRWLDCLINIWPFTTMKIYPIAKILQ